MQLNEYLNSSARTVRGFPEGHHLDSHAMDQLHAAMGMATEVGELVEIVYTASRNPEEALRPDQHVHIAEEIGDYLWYAALILRSFEGSFDDVRRTHPEPLEHKTDSTVPRIGLVLRLAESTAVVIDVMKKHIMYGKPLNAHTIWVEMTSQLVVMETLAALSGYDIEGIAAMNDAKLRARYPDKFTQEAALNRDLQAEAEAMG